jgi:3-hydroxyacyl-CoA dehydrogenase
VSGTATDPAVIERLKVFGEHILAKGIVVGEARRLSSPPHGRLRHDGDHPRHASARRDARRTDAVFGSAIGRANAVFGTADVVGLDTFLHVAQNCWDNLPRDERHDVFATPAFMKAMVDKGMLGRKAEQGFYKKVGEDGRRRRSVILENQFMNFL